jgi:hypothetical protein
MSTEPNTYRKRDDMKIEIATDPATKVRTATIVIVGAELDALDDVCEGYLDHWGGDDCTTADGRLMAESIVKALDVWNPAHRPPPPVPPAPVPWPSTLPGTPV